MTSYDWPRDKIYRPLNGTFNLVPITKISVSPYTGSQKTIFHQHVWHAELSFNNRSMADGLEFQSFIDQLEGGSNSVRLFDQARRRPMLLSTAETGFSDGSLFDDGTGFTDGYNLIVMTAAAKGSRTVALSGFPVSQAVLKRGDLFSINGFLYQTRYDVTSNASGQALVTIQPGLRAAVAANDVVITDYAACSMTLLNAAEALIPRSEDHTSGFTLSFVEIIP